MTPLTKIKKVLYFILFQLAFILSNKNIFNDNFTFYSFFFVNYNNPDMH